MAAFIRCRWSWSSGGKRQRGPSADPGGEDGSAPYMVIALQRVATVKSFREYILGLTFHFKLHSMLGMVTSTTTDVDMADANNDLHVSTVSDAITLLRYMPAGGDMHRVVQVLKMRGSNHDKALRQFTITDRGMQIGDPVADARHVL